MAVIPATASRARVGTAGRVTGSGLAAASRDKAGKGRGQDMPARGFSGPVECWLHPCTNFQALMVCHTGSRRKGGKGDRGGHAAASAVQGGKGRNW